MGCGKSQAAKDPEPDTNSGCGGYTVGQFVEDYLVPVELYSCRLPSDPKRAKDLRRELKDVNDMLLDETIQQENRKPGDKLQITKQVQPPPEAVCRVWLHTANIEGSVNQKMDLKQAARLKVRVRGHLLFPPEVRWFPRTEDIDKSRKMQHFDQRWFMEAEVWLLLEAAVGMEDRRSGEGVSLQVKCLHLKILDKGNGPLADSWLPIKEILQDIENMLETKLQDAISDMGQR